MMFQEVLPSHHIPTQTSLKAQKTFRITPFSFAKKFGRAKGMGRLGCTKDTLYW
jgi:hypothetical protein